MLGWTWSDACRFVRGGEETPNNCRWYYGRQMAKSWRRQIRQITPNRSARQGRSTVTHGGRAVVGEGGKIQAPDKYQESWNKRQKDYGRLVIWSTDGCVRDMEKEETKTNERQDAKQFPFPGPQADYDITHVDGASRVQAPKVTRDSELLTSLNFFNNYRSLHTQGLFFFFFFFYRPR